jgi:tripartite-type tricarboxylate transporter receptor subunit TctC
MRSLSTSEIAKVAGGGTISDVYNAIKYSNWTQAEVAQDLYTAPGATISMTEATVAAADIFWAAGTLSAGVGYEIGTVAYNHMSTDTQDAIGGTIDAAINNMVDAWQQFEDGL